MIYFYCCYVNLNCLFLYHHRYDNNYNHYHFLYYIHHDNNPYRLIFYCHCLLFLLLDVLLKKYPYTGHYFTNLDRRLLFFHYHNNYQHRLLFQTTKMIQIYIIYICISFSSIDLFFLIKFLIGYHFIFILLKCKTVIIL